MGLLVLTLALATTARARTGRGEAAVLLVLTVATVLIFGPPGLIWPLAFVLRACSPAVGSARDRVVSWRASCSSPWPRWGGRAAGGGRRRARQADRGERVPDLPRRPPGRRLRRQLPAPAPDHRRTRGVARARLQVPYSAGVLSTAVVVLAIVLFASGAAGLSTELADVPWCSPLPRRRSRSTSRPGRRRSPTSVRS